MSPTPGTMSPQRLLGDRGSQAQAQGLGIIHLCKEHGTACQERRIQPWAGVVLSSSSPLQVTPSHQHLPGLAPAQR